MASQIPHLWHSTDGRAHQLIVNGKPFLVLAGELQNSSMSSAAFMDTVWPTMVAANVNTVLGSVSWEQIEPREGSFDFTELDRVITGARVHDIHLVLLWFGAFKNALSTYAPSWVKTNIKRFPRAQIRNSDGALVSADATSIFHENLVSADAKAFGALMQHLREIDGSHSTVLMVQVENEVGLLGDSRDRCVYASQKFEAQVPSQLLSMLSSKWDLLHPKLKKSLQVWNHSRTLSGTWEEVFGAGKRTDEIFMAYHFAVYVEHVASVGRNMFPLPLYTNVWQNYSDEENNNPFPTIVGGGGEPGDYPSGGGVINVLDIWQEFTPSLEFIAPDVYLNDYSSSCAAYLHRGQPLFIPEQRRDAYGARRIWNAYASYGAIGTAPFGIDTLIPTDNPFTLHYGLMKKCARYILQAQQNPATSVGFFFDEPPKDGAKDLTPSIVAIFDDWELTIERAFVFGTPSPGFGMVMHLHAGKFLLIGYGFHMRIRCLRPGNVCSGILNFFEKDVDSTSGELLTCRILNGDETRSGSLVVMPSEVPDYGEFPISVTIPARTAIAECELYSIEEE